MNVECGEHGSASPADGKPGRIEARSHATKFSESRLATVACLLPIIVTGCVLRYYIAVKAFFTSFDTGTVGLMALHILKGERPLFFYGQSYMGALEAYLAALMFQVFGVSETTLALSPILFAAGWIAASYALFREILASRAGGLAAALTVAVGGWFMLWFSLASYGGYPATFFFGTLFLWLAVRFGFRDLSGVQRWLHAIAMGLVAALGIWTNLQVFCYLLTGSIVLLAMLLTRRFERKRLGPLLLAALVAVLGFIPFLRISRVWGFASQTMEGLSFEYVGGSVRMLLHVIPSLFRLARPASGLLTGVSGTFLVMAWFLSLWRLWQTMSPATTQCDHGIGDSPAPSVVHTARSLIPALFVVVFFALYLLHPMAQLRAPRYLISAATMFIGSVFGAAVTLRQASVRRLGWLLLVGWCLLNGYAAIRAAADAAPMKRNTLAARSEICRFAEDRKLRHVCMVGSEIDGLFGQALSFHARGHVRFVSSYYERYRPAAESAEHDPHTALLCKKRHLPRVEHSLQSAGVTHYQVDVPSLCVIHDIEVPHASRRSVPPRTAAFSPLDAVEGSASNLFDRVAGSVSAPVVSDQGGMVHLDLDLGSVMPLDGLWLMSSDTQKPSLALKVQTSTNGVDFVQVDGLYNDILPTYVCGNRVYMLGYHSRYDIRFPPVNGRFLRLTFSPCRSSKSRWAFDEVLVFSHIGPADPVMSSDVDRLAEVLRNRPVDFIAADRWLSAELESRLAAAGGGQPSLYPRYDPHYIPSLVSRVLTPRPGLAIAVDSSVAEMCEATLEAVLPPATQVIREEAGPYSMLMFGGDPARYAELPPSLQWNGHIITRLAP